MQDDKSMWLGIGHGDPAAFERVYSAHFARVRDFLRVYLGGGPIVEDVAQETFLQLWQRPNGFNPARSSMKAYLFGIARKRAADWWRHQRPNEARDTEPLSNSAEPALLMSDAFKRLHTDSRIVLWLREAEGYSYEELSIILDVPIGTVRSRLFTAREQLRRIWKSGR